MGESAYKNTLNLPRTEFPMKANLVQHEPDLRRRWAEMDLYRMIRAAEHPKGRYVLHDGPPYANGDIHIGTGINKILKDIVVKYKTMRGYDSPYIPGWDCHGLPIEHKVRTELGAKADRLSATEIREQCRQYALHFAKVQSEQFQSLGVFGRFDKPYLTLDPAYEEGQMEVLAALADEGLLYRDRRAIHWCASCETALAEAELEYADDEGPSLFVLFKLAPMKKHAAGGLGRVPLLRVDLEGRGEPLHLMVWTTTPWTLPANLAVAVHPEYTYAIVRFTKGGRKYTAVIAEDLVATAAKNARLGEVEILTKSGPIPGAELAGLPYEHPFMGPPEGGEVRRVVADASVVTLEEGTGLVHIAPGHGREDNLLGMRRGLPAYSPVLGDGRFDETVPEWIRAKTVWEANPIILARLAESGHLVAEGTTVHRYPHCWRCREPVIFRATEQWFVALDSGETGKSLRQRALEAVGGVQWVPAWNEARIRGTIETRPDWCISRQKLWGVPIPALYCEACGRAVLTGDMMRAAGKFFGQKGSTAWYEATVEEIFGEAPACPDCGGRTWRKETDVFDVWLDSGASWRSVCEAENLGMPVELYLEGSDQHRGWFQSSLVLAVVARGQAPFRTCVTHGFVVDEEGRKMSKSLGNTVNVLDEVGRLGADVVRLWASSTDYSYDIRASDALISNLQDAYRKIRNTLRFLMGNTGDFDPKKNAVKPADLEGIDRWLLARAQQLAADVTAQMEAFQFHRVFSLVHVFCVTDLSAFYLDVQKDCLYCDAADSPRRRSAQTAMAETADVLVRLLAPILVHTAEEAWQHLAPAAGGTREPSVHLARWPEVDANLLDEDLLAHWDWLMDVRRDAYALLEVFRKKGRFAKHTEARVALAPADEKERAELAKVGTETLAALLLVSELVIVSPEESEALEGERAEAGEADQKRFASAVLLPQKYSRCERCWNWWPSVGQGEPKNLCARCRQVLASQ
ncbi:MAG: isoleucine--tRNA ligase [Planctomycetota bacterium]|nr:isoleucine--tRNA ligase [Planctomycetota bacterium]